MTTETTNVPDITRLIGSTAVEARPYQQRIVQRVLSSVLDRNLRSIMIESPTGSGKTIMALLAIKGLQQAIPDLAVGWISMRSNLLSQAQRENTAKRINANVKFISMFEKHLPTEMLALLPDGTPNPDAAKYRALVVDEAQHDAANSMASIHANVMPTVIIGMTATPFRTDHVKLCFDTVLKDAGLASLIRDGYLSQYRHFTIPQWGVADVCEHYLREQERWGKSIMYFHRIEECQRAAAILQAAGVPVEVVTGSSDRVGQIASFVNNRVRVLLNCMVLTEGFDCPDLRSVFCRPSCKGVTIQMSGRVFRKHPEIQVKNVIQPKDGWPFVKLVEPIEQYTWRDNNWLSLTINPRINDLNCEMLKAIASATVRLPTFITGAKMGQRGRSRRRRV